jgi:hypothetical protein
MNYIPIFQQHVCHERWDLEQLTDREGTLSLTLVDSQQKRMQILFDSHMAYRKLDEGDALLMLANIQKTGGTGKYLYKVEDSTFLAWFNQQRCGDVPGQPLVHYCVAAMNDILDVLAINEPMFL